MKRNPSLGLGLRLIVAGYLLYIAYVQFKSLPTTEHFALSLVFGILFTAVGIAFGIWAVLVYRKDTKPAPEEEKEPVDAEFSEAEAAEEKPEMIEAKEEPSADEAAPLQKAEEESFEE